MQRAPHTPARATFLFVTLSLAAWPAAPAAAQDTASFVGSMAEWSTYMTPDELAVFAAVWDAAQQEGVDIVALPVGSWGKRLAARSDQAQLLRRLHPDWSVAEVKAELLTDASLYPGPGSDFDLTITSVPGEKAAAGVIRREAAIVDRVNARVQQHVADMAKYRNRESVLTSPDLVKVMGEVKWHEEKFSGQAGRTFAMNSSPYALHASPGRPLVPLPKEAYYTLRGAPVPKGLGVQATGWLDDAMGIILSGNVAAGTNLTEDVAKTRAALKYWAKYKGFFEGELAATLPPEIGQQMMSRLDEMPSEVSALLTYRNDRLVARLQSMRPDELNELFERTTASMMRYRDQVEVIDLVRRGRILPTAKAAGDVLTRMAAVKKVLLSVGGRVLGSAVRHLLLVPALQASMEQYANGDLVAFSRGVASLLTDLAGAGEAAMAAELADLGRQLAAQGLIAASDAVFFDPLNQQVLAAYYDTAADADGVFTMEGSPFAGLTRETLYARYRMSPDEAHRAIARDAAAFVGRLPKNAQLVGHRVTGLMDLIYRLGFLAAGPGSLTDTLTAALMADWEHSRRETEALIGWADLLRKGYYIAEPPPLEVFVDGEPVAAGTPAQVTWTLAPGASQTKSVDIVRRYGRRFAIPGALRTAFADSRVGHASYYGTLGQRPGDVVARMMEVFESGFPVVTPPKAPGLPPSKPVQLRGRAGVEQWVAASSGLFEVEPLTIAHNAARVCNGWTIEAPWDAGPGWDAALSLPYPDPNGEGVMKVAVARATITVTAPAAEAEPCRLDETLAITWRAPVGGATQSFAVYLRAAMALTARQTALFEVGGRVTRADTGESIPGARLTLAGDRTFTTTSAADGSAALADIPAGTYEIAIAHPGFETRRATLEVTRDLVNGKFALTPLAVEKPAAPQVPALPPPANVGTQLERKFSVSFGDNYVPKADKTDAGQRLTFTVPGPGTLKVTYTYRPSKPLTIRYYGDENGYRAQARVVWSVPGGAKPGRVNAGMLYRGTTQLTETTGTGTAAVAVAGEVELKAYPEETPAYFYRNQWVDNWYDATHTHYHGATATIVVTFTPASR